MIGSKAPHKGVPNALILFDDEDHQPIAHILFSKEQARAVILADILEEEGRDEVLELNVHSALPPTSGMSEIVLTGQGARAVVGMIRDGNPLPVTRTQLRWGTLVLFMTETEEQQPRAQSQFFILANDQEGEPEFLVGYSRQQARELLKARGKWWTLGGGKVAEPENLRFFNEALKISGLPEISETDHVRIGGNVAYQLVGLFLRIRDDAR